MKKVILAGVLGFAALAGTNLPGLEATKASAAVENVQDNQMLHQGNYLEENNAFEYEIGKVVNVYEDKVLNQVEKYVTFEYTGKDGGKLQIPVLLTKGQKFNKGDKVKVDMRNVFENIDRWVEDGIEKINESKTTGSNEERWVWGYKQTNHNELKPGFYEKTNGSTDYAIGKITKVGKGLYGPGDQTDYVVVKTPNKSGEEESIYVLLTEGQKFSVGDKVKVNMENVSWGGNNVNWEGENNIEKINESKTTELNEEQWVWGS
ncbi:ATP synthase F0F1 subunit alpha [Bacillus cereus]|uniref:ATP synthase F0F1 subunit alpha n=1 Tax=Bacillus cereus TaxID=1396 RepID=A0A9X7BCZ7_BACCE|nr:ATP synthase F0F1 subunit alpha [Bacillus cereus]PED40333.1 ATP synthase F0F1 subunit alpha [Bacillus cereus]PFV08306.1 ATP synthase F0F1 subunit alpha [Bacillus cereus]